MAGAFSFNSKNAAFTDYLPQIQINGVSLRPFLRTDERHGKNISGLCIEVSR
jgi:hypothetical protein